MSHHGQRLQVPNDLRDTLLEFTISYLLEQPGDMIDYTAEYFSRLRNTRTTELIYADVKESSISQSSSSTSSEEFNAQNEAEDSVSRDSSYRRKSVYAEAYNPEEDDDDEKEEKRIFPKSDEQRVRLGEAVGNILLFRSLDKEQMQDVLDAMFEKRVQPGDYVIKQGDDGDNFYVIESGKFHVLIAPDLDKEPQHVHTYEDSGSFGELALLYNMPRAATIEAVTDGLLWGMDRATFRRIILKSAFKKRKMYEALLDSVPMLKTLQSYERMSLADALIPKSFSEGEKIITQGETADGMYFIEAGEVSITVMNPEEKDIEIKHLGKGDYFGELALVTHRPRAATAYAVGDVRVAFLDVGAFERLLGPCMDIMKRNIEDYEDQMLKIFGTKQHRLSG